MLWGEQSFLFGDMHARRLVNKRERHVTNGSYPSCWGDFLTDISCVSLCITDLRRNCCTHSTETMQHWRLKVRCRCQCSWTWHCYSLCAQAARIHEAVVLFAPFSFVICRILSRWPTLRFIVKSHTHAHTHTSRLDVTQWKKGTQMLIQVSLCATRSLNSSVTIMFLTESEGIGNGPKA